MLKNEGILKIRPRSLHPSSYDADLFKIEVLGNFMPEPGRQIFLNTALLHNWQF